MKRRTPFRNKKNKTPGDVNALLHQAATLFQQGNLLASESLLNNILVEGQQHADAYNLLGLIAGRRRQHDLSIQSFTRAIENNPGEPKYHNNLGLALRSAGQFTEALVAFEQAIQLNSEYADAHNNRATVLYVLNRSGEALIAFERAIHLNPIYADAHSNRGNVLNELGRQEDALVAYENAIRLNPNNAHIHNNRGVVLMGMGRREEGLKAYERAIQLDPGFAMPHNNRGNVLKDMGCLAEAEISYRRVIELEPGHTLANDNYLLCLNYRSDITVKEVLEAHRKWGLRTANRQLQTIDRTSTGNRDSSRRLRVGYVSPDFRNHSVAYFFEPLLRSHNRKAIEVFCYSNVRHPDGITERLRSMSDHWTSVVSMSDDEAAEQICKDQIDILVDLMGHTRNNRLPVFAYKPAPIQVSWLGYPMTTGMQEMDYRFTDAVADPENETDQLYAETLVRLAGGFLSYLPPEEAPAVSVTPALGAGYITFGSFNALAKITPEVILVWSQILNRVPQSRLLMKDKAFTDLTTRKRYLDLFSDHGINCDRINLCGTLPTTGEHLDLYGSVDIALDPFPYNGTTTTCEALWMGVPVVTLSGDRHAARVGASIIGRVGYTEWVTSTTASYIEAAACLAGDIKELTNIRNNLRNQMQTSPLCDADSFASSIESAYQAMRVKQFSK